MTLVVLVNPRKTLASTIPIPPAQLLKQNHVAETIHLTPSTHPEPLYISWTRVRARKRGSTRRSTAYIQIQNKGHTTWF
jgi:hypothetical protein